MLGGPVRLGLGHGAARRTLVANEAHGHDPAVHDVGADLAVGALDQLLDLLQERIDGAPSAPPLERIASRMALGHVVADGLGVTAGQRRG